MNNLDETYPSEAELENGLCAVTALVLQEFPGRELAALNNALDFTQVIPPYNLAYQRAVEAALIDETGRPRDLPSLQRAAAYEVNRRVAAGSWN